MSVLKGNSSANTINGTSSADTIYGYDGADVISGMNGADYLYGGTGADTLHGNSGNDTAMGGDGDDWLYGDDGNDRLVSDAGDDNVFGGDGVDYLNGSTGNDTLDGGTGNDSLYGGDGNDVITGGDGDDLLAGNSGADRFVLGIGNGFDTINDWNPSQGDVIDLMGALSGFNPDTNNITDFIKVVRNPGTSTTTISIDANGLGDGVASFVNIGLLKNSTYTSVAAMIADGVMIVPKPTGGTPAHTFVEPHGTSDEFIEFLGVCVKNDSPLASDANALINSLNYLGIENIRSSAGPVGFSQLYDSLANAGIDFDFLMPREADAGGKALINEYISDFKAFLAAHPDSIKSIEGINEFGDPDFSFDYEGLTGKAAVVQYQKDLYNAINAEESLKDIPVYNFTVWRGQDSPNFVGFEDTSNYSDAATTHVYVNTNRQPYYEMTTRLDLARQLDTNSSNVITELGYPSNPIVGNSQSVSEGAQAKLLLNLIMDSYDHDVQSAYFYELFDGGSNKTDNQDNFGLFNLDGTAKASATAMHNFTTILKMDTGPGAVNTVGYDLDNGNSNTHSVSLAKSGGATELIIWQEEQIWDYANLKDIIVASRTVHVTLDETAQSVDVYDPILGTQSTAHMTNTHEFDVQVTDHPIILLIDL